MKNEHDRPDQEEPVKWSNSQCWAEIVCKQRALDLPGESYRGRDLDNLVAEYDRIIAESAAAVAKLPDAEHEKKMNTIFVKHLNSTFSDMIQVIERLEDCEDQYVMIEGLAIVLALSTLFQMDSTKATAIEQAKARWREQMAPAKNARSQKADERNRRLDGIISKVLSENPQRSDATAIRRVKKLAENEGMTAENTGVLSPSFDKRILRRIKKWKKDALNRVS